jgi:hypothetical protein
MPHVHEQERADLGERKVIFLEFLAAFTILSIVALVLYMVFSYKPS